MRLPRPVTQLGRILSRFSTHRLTRRLLALSSGTAIGHLVVLASTPILTRLYGPDAFGQFGVVYAIVVLFGVIGLLQLEVDLPLCAEDELSAALLAQITIVIGMLALVLTLAWLLPLPPALRTLPRWAWWLLPVACLLQVAMIALAYLHVRRGAFARYGWQSMNRLVAVAAAQILLSELGGLGLLLGLIVGQLVAVATGFPSLRPELARLRSCSFAASFAYLRRARRYPLYLLPANLLAVAGHHLGPLLVASIFSATEAGLFLLVQHVFAAPIRLVSQSLSQVLLGELRETERSRLARLARRSILLLGGSGSLLAALAVLPGDAGWRLLLGPQWDGFGTVMLCLAPLQIAIFVSEATRNFFLVVDNRLLLLQSAGTTASLASFALPVVAAASFPATLLLYAALATTVHVLFLVLLLARLDRAAATAGHGRGTEAFARAPAGGTAIISSNLGER